MEEDSVVYFKSQAEGYERAHLFKKAAFSSEHDRLEKEDDYRMPYRRDVDAIIHSNALARTLDKTQVLYLIANDHVSSRGLHIQLVSNLSRGLAIGLKLNSDLVEAIALGHDVGHPPFGHEGESYLSSLSSENGGGAFSHASHACRIFSSIEPLNLSLAVYDGILCHDGGLSSAILKPSFKKNFSIYKLEYAEKQKDPTYAFLPMTLEGCLVRLCDTISYVGRDIEDAVRLKLIQRKDIPSTHLGRTNQEIIRYLYQDILRNSYEKDYIALSRKAFLALKTLREFNFKRIYRHPRVLDKSTQIKEGYCFLFDYLLQNTQAEKKKSVLWRSFLHDKSEAYLKETLEVQQVVDFIAGMTDGYFLRLLNALQGEKPCLNL